MRWNPLIVLLLLVALCGCGPATVSPRRCVFTNSVGMPITEVQLSEVTQGFETELIVLEVAETATVTIPKGKIPSPVIVSWTEDGNSTQNLLRDLPKLTEELPDLRFTIRHVKGDTPSVSIEAVNLDQEK